MTEIKSNPVKKTGQINVELDTLDYKVEEMRKVIKRLEEKLNPILSTSDSGDGKEPVLPPLCPLAVSIYQLSKSIESMNLQLDDITNRIEL